MRVYLWALFHFTGLCSFFMPVPHCFNYYAFVRCFEIKKCESFNFAFLFLGYLAIWIPLRFNMNFRMDFSLSAKKKKENWNFDRGCVESVGSLWVVLTYQQYSVCQYTNTDVFSFICVFSNFFEQCFVVLVYKPFTFLVSYIPNYTFFDATVS